MTGPDQAGAPAPMKASRAFFWASALTVLLLDQASKWLVAARLELHQAVPVIGNVVNLTYVRNAGAAFSLLTRPWAAPWRLYFLISVAAITIVILAVLAYRERQAGPAFLLALGCVCGGAAGNMLDRLRLGMVVDFIDIGVGAYHWPVFNVADSMINIGVAWIILLSLRRTASGRPALGGG